MSYGEVSCVSDGTRHEDTNVEGVDNGLSEILCDGLRVQD